MAPRKQRPASFTRWGLLITTVALGTILVGMGMVSYLGARQTAQAVVRARGLDMAMTVRRELRHSEGALELTLSDVLDEMEEQGLTYAAVGTREQGIVAQAGESETDVSHATFRGFRPGTGPVVVLMDDAVRVVSNAGGGRRALERQGPRWRGKTGRKGWGWRAQRWWKNRGKAGRGPWQSEQASQGPEFTGPPILVMEFEPQVASAVVRRALLMLIASLVTASVLLLAAVFFWRSSRRAELMQAQLAQDNQLKALGQMSAVLGHELRNPLAALKGHAQLLVELLSEHPGLKGAQTVVREAVRMEKLTEQILDFARTGSVDKTAENPVDVAKAAQEQAGAGWIELDADDGIADWPLDRIRIERVLINLLKNAIQASPSGSVVSLTVKAADKGLVYEVRDHGEGLPEGEEGWIFEPFHTKRVKGTGLGLAVSKRIVDAHEGKISASNHPDGGAVFRVWLPAS